MNRRLACLLAVLAVLASGCTLMTPKGANPPVGGAVDGTVFDAGNIISDAVFYNATAMTAAQIQTFLDSTGSGCTDPGCLRSLHLSPGPASSSWCTTYPGGTNLSFAEVLAGLAVACGINPQVALTIIQKESQGLTRVPPAALTGFGCPDTGPGGSANCSAAVSGVWSQTYGMMQAFAHAHQDGTVVARYIEGPVPHAIFWNVEETGCGAGDVTVTNRATATLYTYTPYQPNAASLAAYPGEGDACSSYGNRNFWRMFQNYFGPTGGGKAIAAGGGTLVAANGINVTLPTSQFVAEAARGKTIAAPTEELAKGLAAGFSKLGMPYVWGGGGSGAAENNGCSRGGGALNSCGSEIGFDCSGLTAFVLVQGGAGDPGGESSTQRATGQDVPWSQGQAGDIVGFNGHVAIYLGLIDGQRYILEASQVGTPIHIVPLTRTDYDDMLHRHWGSGSSA